MDPIRNFFKNKNFEKTGIILFFLIAMPMLIISAIPKLKVITSDYTMRSGGEISELKKGLSVKHANLEFTIMPKNKMISGIATLTFYTKISRSKIALDLDRVFQIQSIKVNKQVIASSHYKNPDGLLIIDLPLPVNGQFTVSIAYSGKPRIAKRAPWDGGFVWSKTKDNQDWIATAVQGEGGDLFWPCLDQPMGEPETLDIHIKVPAPLFAASNGIYKGVSKAGNFLTYHWQSKTQINNYGIALNIGPYKLMQDTYQSHYGNEIDLKFYYLPQSSKKIAKLFAELPLILDFFEHVIGPYPFADEKVGIVQTPHLGMEHQTINAYGNHFRKNEYGYDWLMQHEFSHEWFGNQMTCNDWDHMWLHEGFGAYMQPLYSLYLHGDMAYKSQLYGQRKSLRNKYPLVSNRPMTESEVYDKEKGPGGDIYVKGSLILHSLRELIGDKAFFAATRELVYGRVDPRPGNFKPRYSDSAEFIKLVNRHSKTDLQWFFDVYLYKAALPELIVVRNTDSMILEWKTEQNSPFPMPLEIKINGKVRKLDLTSPQTIHTEQSDVVIIDPMSKVLKYEKHIEDFKEYRKQQGKKKRKK